MATIPIDVENQLKIFFKTKKALKLSLGIKYGVILGFTAQFNSMNVYIDEWKTVECKFCS